MGKRRHGEGSVYKRGRSWAYLMPRSLVAPGERGYQGGFATSREARDALRDAITAARKGEHVKRSVDSVREYVENVFLPKERTRLRSSTYTRYERALRVHVLPAIGDERMQSVSAMMLQQLWTGMLAGVDGRDAISPRSVQIVYGVVRKVFADAMKQRIVLHNPAPESNPPTGEAVLPPAPEIWTGEQIAAFLAFAREAECFPDVDPGAEPSRGCRTCERDLPRSMFAGEPKGRDGLKLDCRECVATRRRGSDDGSARSTAVLQVHHDSLFPLYLLAARTGMRRGELCGLRWGDVDLDAGTAQLRQQYANDGSGAWVFDDLKTKRSRRLLPLDTETVTVLRRHRAIQNRRRLQLGPTYRAGLDLVFARADGGPIHPGQVSRRFKDLARGAGLPVIKFHGLRHSVATILSEADLAGASDLLGHFSPAFTARQYVHPDLDRLRRLQSGLA